MIGTHCSITAQESSVREVVDPDSEGLRWAEMHTRALEVGHNYKRLPENGKLRTEWRFSNSDIRTTKQRCWRCCAHEGAVHWSAL